MLKFSNNIQQLADSERSNSATHYIWGKCWNLATHRFWALKFSNLLYLSAKIWQPADSDCSNSATCYICTQDPWHPCKYNDPNLLCTQIWATAEFWVHKFGNLASCCFHKGMSFLFYHFTIICQIIFWFNNLSTAPCFWTLYCWQLWYILLHVSIRFSFLPLWDCQLQYLIVL